MVGKVWSHVFSDSKKKNVLTALTVLVLTQQLHQLLGFYMVNTGTRTDSHDCVQIETKTLQGNTRLRKQQNIFFKFMRNETHQRMHR